MEIFLAVLLSSALAALAGYKQAMTSGGLIAAWLMCMVITVFGGLPAFALLVETFILVIAADKLAGKRADPHGLRRKSGARDAQRVLCNVGFPAVSMLLYGITHNEAFFFVYISVIAEALSDSLASKIGPMAKGKTVDICTLRETPTGLSGGISLAGTAAAFIGSVIAGATSLCFSSVTCSSAALAAALGFCGCLLDSLLGSLAQVRYICPICGVVTEREVHCGAKTSVCKGLRPINNDAVNLISNAFVFFAAILGFSF